MNAYIRIPINKCAYKVDTMTMAASVTISSCASHHKQARSRSRVQPTTVQDLLQSDTREQCYSSDGNMYLCGKTVHTTLQPSPSITQVQTVLHGCTTWLVTTQASRSGAQPSHTTSAKHTLNTHSVFARNYIHHIQVPS